MNRSVKALLIVLFTVAKVLAADRSVVEAVRASADVRLQTDPASAFWRAARPAYLERDKDGTLTSHFRSEVRIRWTKDNLYFLFICPYDELYLKPSPTTTEETNKLWNWDVAEVFISSNFSDINRYQEFEVSPQGEWLDLDIDLNKPHHEDGWTWNSGFAAIARADATRHRWYAAMRIPLSAIDKRSPADGMEFRMNLFVSEGPPSNHHAVTWRPPMSDTFHVPARFGLLRLVSEKRQRDPQNVPLGAHTRALAWADCGKLAPSLVAPVVLKEFRQSGTITKRLSSTFSCSGIGSRHVGEA